MDQDFLDIQYRFFSQAYMDGADGVEYRPEYPEAGRPEYPDAGRPDYHEADRTEYDLNKSSQRLVNSDLSSSTLGK